jgi:TetR/AcrR family transcriptional regulator
MPPGTMEGTQMGRETEKPRTRIQIRNREAILDAALEVFSQHGFRGATVDMIASQAGLSKPNLLYYFPSKEDIHVTLLSQLMDTWLDPLRALDANGDPVDELLSYMRRKLEMSRDFPRESRLFANEIVQGAPRIGTSLSTDLKALVDEKAQVIVRHGRHHLIFSSGSSWQVGCPRPLPRSHGRGRRLSHDPLFPPCPVRPSQSYKEESRVSAAAGSTTPPPRARPDCWDASSSVIVHP